LLKIVHIVTRLDKGGLADTVLYLAKGLVQIGYHITVIAGNTADPHPSLDLFLKEKYFPLYFIKDLQRNINPMKDLIVLWKLIKLLGKLKPDIVHTHSSKSGLLGRMAAAYWNIPIIIHSPHGHIFYGYFNRFISRIFITIERWLAKFTTQIITLTLKGKQDHLKYKVGRASQFSIVPCGINFLTFGDYKKSQNFRQNSLCMNGERLVGWVGRLVPIKGCDVFLKSCKELINLNQHRIKVIVVGDGEIRGELENLAQQLGINDHISFLGNRTDVAAIMKSLDIFVLSSYNEGFGRVLVEAMHCGVPIVATNVGGVPELIKNGFNGYLIPGGESQAMTQAIFNLLSNEQIAQRFSVNGRQIADQFSFENMIRQTDQVYRRMNLQ